MSERKEPRTELRVSLRVEVKMYLSTFMVILINSKLRLASEFGQYFFSKLALVKMANSGLPTVLFNWRTPKSVHFFVSRSFEPVRVYISQLVTSLLKKCNSMWRSTSSMSKTRPSLCSLVHLPSLSSVNNFILESEVTWVSTKTVLIIIIIHHRPPSTYLDLLRVEKLMPHGQLVGCALEQIQI